MSEENEMRVYSIDLEKAAMEAAAHDKTYQAMKKSVPPELRPALYAGYVQGFTTGVRARALRAEKVERKNKGRKGREEPEPGERRATGLLQEAIREGKGRTRTRANQCGGTS